MSNTVSSKIFDSINNYFHEYLDEEFELIVSEKALPNADIYHYHRPNLEKNILKNSVITVHHDLCDLDPAFNLSEYIEKYEKCDQIVCLNSTQEKILNSKGLNNTTVIPHGYNKNIFSLKEVHKYSPEKKICLGIISKRYARRVKGEAYLFELLKRLNPNKFSFFLVGENRREDYKLIDRFGFDVELHEDLPYILFNQLYHKIDFLLILSLHEGGPANIPEALATGTPIISRLIGMAPDLILDNKNGLFLSDDIDIDIKLLADISNNKNNIFDHLQQSSQNIYHALTWKEVVKLHENIYKKMLKIDNES